MQYQHQQYGVPPPRFVYMRPPPESSPFLASWFWFVLRVIIEGALLLGIILGVAYLLDEEIEDFVPKEIIDRLVEKSKRAKIPGGQPQEPGTTQEENEEKLRGFAVVLVIAYVVLFLAIVYLTFFDRKLGIQKRRGIVGGLVIPMPIIANLLNDNGVNVAFIGVIGGITGFAVALVFTPSDLFRKVRMATNALKFTKGDLKNWKVFINPDNQVRGYVNTVVKAHMNPDERLTQVVTPERAEEIGYVVLHEHTSLDAIKKRGLSRFLVYRFLNKQTLEFVPDPKDLWLLQKFKQFLYTLANLGSANTPNLEENEFLELEGYICVTNRICAKEHEERRRNQEGYGSFSTNAGRRMSSTRTPPYRPQSSRSSKSGGSNENLSAVLEPERSLRSIASDLAQDGSSVANDFQNIANFVDMLDGIIEENGGLTRQESDEFKTSLEKKKDDLEKEIAAFDTVFDEVSRSNAFDPFDGAEWEKIYDKFKQDLGFMTKAKASLSPGAYARLYAIISIFSQAENNRTDAEQALGLLNNKVGGKLRGWAGRARRTIRQRAASQQQGAEEVGREEAQTLRGLQNQRGRLSL